MPTYDYVCTKCSRKFHTVMSITDHDRRKPKCPKCGSGRVTQTPSGFFATTSKKS